MRAADQLVFAHRMPIGCNFHPSIKWIGAIPSAYNKLVNLGYIKLYFGIFKKAAVTADSIWIVCNSHGVTVKQRCRVRIDRNIFVAAANEVDECAVSLSLRPPNDKPPRSSRQIIILMVSSDLFNYI